MSERGDDRRKNFVRDVMNRTSGSPCGRALELLPDLTDGALASLDRQLVQQHLEHCADCRAVALVLTRQGDDLVSLAELDPGPGFTAAVVKRTTGRSEAAVARRRDAVAGSGPAGLMDRVGRWWQKRILVPDFAMQVAYAATIAIVLVTVTPGSPLRGAPRKALAAVQAGPAGLPLTGTAVAWMTHRAETTTDGALMAARRGVDTAWDEVSGDWQRRSARSQPARTALADHLDTAIAAVVDRDPAAAAVEALTAFESGRAAWSAWWANQETTGQEDGP